MGMKIKIIDALLMVCWILEGIPLLRLQGVLSNLYLLWGSFYIFVFVSVHFLRQKREISQQYLFGVIVGIHLLSSIVSCTLYWVYHMFIGLLLPLLKIFLLFAAYKWSELSQK